MTLCKLLEKIGDVRAIRLFVNISSKMEIEAQLNKILKESIAEAFAPPVIDIKEDNTVSIKVIVLVKEISNELREKLDASEKRFRDTYKIKLVDNENNLREIPPRKYYHRI